MSASLLTAETLWVGEVRVEIGVLVHFPELVGDLVVSAELGPDRRQQRPRGRVEPDALIFPSRPGVVWVIPIQ